MSDLAMTVPSQDARQRYAELLITLPDDWPVDQESLQQEMHWWPFRLLQSLARFPHEYGTYLGYGHTIPNGDPPTPFDQSTDLCGAILLHPVLLAREFCHLTTSSGSSINFYSVVPLLVGELQLKLRSGLDELLDHLDRFGVNELIDPDRRSPSRSRWNPFG
jgi:hypothetical protein